MPGMNYGVRNGIVDLIGATAINWGASTMAAQSPNMRWTFGAEPTNNAFMDVRVIGGALGTAAAIWGNGMMARVGHDAALGLFGSFVATDRIRSACLARLEQAQPQTQAQVQQPGGWAAPPAQIAPQVPPATAPPVSPTAQILQEVAKIQEQAKGAGWGPGSYR